MNTYIVVMTGTSSSYLSIYLSGAATAGRQQVLPYECAAHRSFPSDLLNAVWYVYLPRWWLEGWVMAMVMRSTHTS